MTIQNAVNQILGSAGRAIGAAKLTKAAKTYVDEPKKSDFEAENRMIAEAKLKDEVENREARELGFPNAQVQHKVQSDAARAAEKLKEKDPKFGFYTDKPQEGAASWSEEPNPADRYNLGKPDLGSAAVNNGIVRINERAANLSRQRDTIQFYDRFGDILRGGNANG